MVDTIPRGYCCIQLQDQIRQANLFVVSPRHAVEVFVMFVVFLKEGESVSGLPWCAMIQDEQAAGQVCVRPHKRMDLVSCLERSAKTKTRT